MPNHCGTEQDRIRRAHNRYRENGPRNQAITRTVEFVGQVNDSWNKIEIAENDKITWTQYLRQKMAEFEAGPRPPSNSDAVEFSTVSAAELREILIRRKLAGEDPDFNGGFEEISKLPGVHPYRAEILRVAIVNAFGADERYPPVVEEPPDPDQLKQVQLTGLALSGGGIRSATFSLGILQGLASLDLLKKADYLSTVSGGGYIGAWLAAWIKRSGFETVNLLLNPERNKEAQSKGQDLLTVKRPIRYLRQYSNYLTPQLGILSGDTWAMAAIYTRNTALNMLTVIALLGSALLVPRFLLWAGQHCPMLDRTNVSGPALMLWSAVCGAVVLLIIGMRVRGFSCKPIPETDTVQTRRWYEAMFSVPRGIFVALAGTAIWAAHLRLYDISANHLALSGFRRLAWIPLVSSGWWPPANAMWSYFWSSCSIPAVALMLFGLGYLGDFFGCFAEIAPVKGWKTRPLAILWLAGAATLSSVVFSFLNHALHLLFQGWTDEKMLAFAPPLTLLESSAAIILFIGLMGRYFPDARREWIGRFGGWLIIAGIGWALLGTVVFFAPELISKWPRRLSWSATTLWVISVLLGVLAAKNPGTGRRSTAGEAPRSTALDNFTVVVPYLFLAGAFLAVSLAIDAALGHYEFVYKEPVALAAVLFSYAVLSISIDINEFSMHHFYKNRLIRCYLGASNPKRRSDSFTGFDPHDDIRLAKFAPSRTTNGLRAYEGPYPVVNAALNMTSGEDLAYQERQADSFVFTPLFCGVSEALDKKLAHETTTDPAPAAYINGYRPTTCERTNEAYAYPAEGIHLGSAISISGAAASPNWGYHTSPPVAFLLSVFNVRLGWWLGNPRDQKKWQRSSPAIGSAYELKELFGFADPNSQFVYLSDGGHFENLAIYELVRRRCKYIIACDGEEDHAFGFEGLGNAIRKVRADFGIDIDLDLDQLRPKDKLSKWHCVVGKVHYEQRYQDDEPGILVYIKASLTGDEPGDILQYALRNAEFPHQSTGDQWFDESQFESYRKLGYHVARSVFEKAVADSKNENTGVEPAPNSRPPVFREAKGSGILRTADLFNALQQRWFAPSEAIAKSFTRHGEQFDALMRRLESDKNLRFLDWQFYPTWGDLDRFASVTTPRQMLERAATRFTGQLPPEGARWLPNTAEELRAGFYFANSLFQLMENVYLDLNLEESSGHPDNRGWINLFNHWAESGMVRVAWAISAPTFGARFQTFCRKELELELGTIEISPLEEADITYRERDSIQGYDQSYQKYALRIRVKDPRNKGEAFMHRFGLVLIDNNAIVFLRVRRQFRTMGLARRSLNLLMLSGVGTSIKEDEVAEPAALVEFKRLFESVRQG